MIPDTLLTLGRKRDALIEAFRKTPREYDDEAWQALYREYDAAGCVANASYIADKIEQCRDILRIEHTPMVPGDDEPWQLRADIA